MTKYFTLDECEMSYLLINFQVYSGCFKTYSTIFFTNYFSVKNGTCVLQQGDKRHDIVLTYGKTGQNAQAVTLYVHRTFESSIRDTSDGVSQYLGLRDIQV